jgi:hypothetical protein
MHSKHKYPIILNSDSYLGRNKFRYTFPLGSVSLRDAKIALQSINIYYSWYNISAEYNNTIFTLAFPQGAGYAYYEVTIPDGYYNISMLNSYLQSFMVQNSLYLINENNQNVYYFEMLSNPSYYAIQINLFDVPSSLPTDWTAPSGFIFPTTPKKPFVTIGADNNFGNLIGFDAGDYTAASQISTKCPQMATVQSVIVQCPNLKNVLSNPATNLYIFTQGSTTFGDLITSQAHELVYVDIIDCTISYLDIELVDQNFNSFMINDPNVAIQLIIEM